MSSTPLILKGGFVFRKYVYTAIFGAFSAHAVQTSYYLKSQDKEKKERDEKQKQMNEFISTKKQLESVTSLLQSYRSAFPSFEAQTQVTTEETKQVESPSFSYSNLEVDDYLEKYALSYDAEEKNQSYASMSDDMELAIEKAESSA